MQTFFEPNTMLVLGCLGIAQALFLCIYLFTLKSGNRVANVMLGLVLLGLIFRIGKAVIYNYTPIGPWPRNLGISGFLLVGPSLWFYGKALFQRAGAFSRMHYLHFAPFVLFLLLSPVIPNRGDVLSTIAYSFVQVHLVAYLGMCWYSILSADGRARSAIIKWYRGVVSGVTVIWILYAAIFVGVLPFYVLGATAFSFLIYVFAFVFLKKHHFVLEKYAKSSVDPGESKKLMEQVKRLFKDEEVYLSEDASLTVVAEKLTVRPRVLSQAINENEGMNFSEFVNYYRIEHAKQLLTDPYRKQDKIAAIAFDSGFGNVTSFNVAFKERVKMTPSQYRKQFAVV